MATSAWQFPGCPAHPTEPIAWEPLLAAFPWLRDLAHTPQNPFYHAEGDVLIHTRMVAEALVQLPQWWALPPTARALLFGAALLHDVAKPICTEIDDAGRVHSPRHARKGEYLARSLLWRDPAAYGGIAPDQREAIARLVRFHGLPLWFFEKSQPELAVIAASMAVRLDWVALLAEADVRGRICADATELLGRVELFREFCAELGCRDQPRAFPSAHSRFVYFQSERPDLHYAAYDDTRCDVVLMCGLPASGKDTWVQRHCVGLPVIALDALREELEIEPGENPGPVVNAAKQQARGYLQQGQSFVWNATNITRSLRRQLISFFSAYRARVRIVWVEAPFALVRQRNAQRRDPVPERVIMRMLQKFEAPDLTEAHVVEHVLTG